MQLNVRADIPLQHRWDAREKVACPKESCRAGVSRYCRGPSEIFSADFVHQERLMRYYIETVDKLPQTIRDARQDGVLEGLGNVIRDVVNGGKNRGPIVRQALEAWEAEDAARLAAEGVALDEFDFGAYDTASSDD